MKKKQTFLLLLVITLLLNSCTSLNEVLYLQDVNNDVTMQIGDVIDSKISINDKLSIIITCSNPDAAIIYNTPMIGVKGIYSQSTQTSENVANGYTVDNNGNINFPEIGDILVQDLTTDSLTNLLEQKLKAYIKDPIVSVQYMNFRVSILGDVNHPQTLTVKSGELTLLEALSKVGDLNMLAARNSVLIIRTEDGVRSFHRLDLRSKDIFTSEYYYLKQNDIVYIEPTKASVFSQGSGNIILPYAISIVSLLTTITFAIINTL